MESPQPPFMKAGREGILVTPVPSREADPSAEFILNATEGLGPGLSNHSRGYSERLQVIMRECRDRRSYA